LIHKRIPFETVWVEFADIEKVSKEVGIAPNGKKADGTDRYTLPAIKDQETGHSLADSFKIAQYLDKKYPEHTLVPAGAEAQQAALVDSLSEAVGLVRSSPS
jgi:glutathione S-transferase